MSARSIKRYLAKRHDEHVFDLLDDGLLARFATARVSVEVEEEAVHKHGVEEENQDNHGALWSKNGGNHDRFK